MYLLDTDTLIYGLKNMPFVVARHEATAHRPKAMSVVSYGELVFGAHRSQHPEKNMAAVHRLAESFPVIDVTRAVMETFGDLKATLIKRGTPVEDFDLVIAATAIALNYRLVTNNERHFRGVPGLVIENWTKTLSR